MARQFHYYINHRWKNKYPKFRKKWEKRKGKAIHNKSDFGNPLIKWKDRFKGIKQIENNKN